jgi:hypothetical protein
MNIVFKNSNDNILVPLLHQNNFSYEIFCYQVNFTIPELVNFTATIIIFHFLKILDIPLQIFTPL